MMAKPGDTVTIFRPYGGDQSRTPAVVERVTELPHGSPLLVVGGVTFSQREGFGEPYCGTGAGGRPLYCLGVTP